MTIDEMKEFALLCFLMSKRDDKESIVEIFNALDELEWYKKQDLIPRKDALVRTAQAVSPSDIYTKIFITLKQIPKVEYKGEDNE